MPANIDLLTRIANLETAVFGGANPNFAAPWAAAVATLLVGSQVEPPTQYTATGAIAPAAGLAILKAGSAAAMTLVAPTAGAQSAGGQDGLVITIIAADAFAYTVTTPANAVNGAKHIGTWTAAVGNGIVLQAFNGVWYTVGTPQGVALT